MIHSIYFPPGNAPRIEDLANDQIQAALNEPEGLLWISMEQPNPQENGLMLRDIFHFHPLAIEDCATTTYQAPKVDDYGSYLFLIVHAIHSDHSAEDLETDELNIFMGPNYLVTSHMEHAMQPVEFVWKRLERDERLYSNGSDFLCHAILDKLVDDFMPIIDHLDAEIEDLEDKVMATPRVETLEKILGLKHTIISLRRIISPQREIINRLSRDDFPMIDRQSRIYFRDIYDHLVRIQDLSESIRDVISGTMDIYLNSTSLRLNTIMKALTIVSTIFLPLSFVAGVYGMNFSQNLPDLTWQFGIYFFWAVCILIAAGMLFYFKKQGWF
jgi:magnesium transporter